MPKETTHDAPTQVIVGALAALIAIGIVYGVSWALDCNFALALFGVAAWKATGATEYDVSGANPAARTISRWGMFAAYVWAIGALAGAWGAL